MARARRYVMLSERIDGETAVDWGLAHESVSDAELDATMGRWEARLLGLPELAVTMAKAHFRGYARGAALGDLSETDGDLGAIVRSTPDFKDRFSNF